MLLLIPALVCLVGGLAVPCFVSRKTRAAFVFSLTLLVSVFLTFVSLSNPGRECLLLQITPLFSISFQVDPVNRIFLLLIAFLWPLAVLYALEYMEHDERARAPRVTIDPSVAKSVFISIGRNRRVFPRDLLGLLISVGGLERERIGEIKVLTSYSFVQLYAEDCEKIIAALNGYDYRGRKLTVGYSRKTGDEDGDQVSAESTSAEEPGINNDPIPENVTNTAHADESQSSEAAKIAAEQSEFAARQSSVSSGSASDENIKPFFETTDDGQVKSRFNNQQ